MSAPKFHILDGLPASVSPSSHASEADGFVFLTGQFARDLDDPGKLLPEGIRAQTEQALRNMRRVLESLGLSMGQVMSVRVFLTHFKRDYDAMNEIDRVDAPRNGDNHLIWLCFSSNERILFGEGPINRHRHRGTPPCLLIARLTAMKRGHLTSLR